MAPRIVERGGSPIALAWSPDGHTVAASTDNNVLRFYRAGPTYRQVGNGLVTEDDTMIALAISPDGRSIATGSSSGIVRQYDVATHERVGPDLRGHTFEVGGIAYSSDGSLLASTTVGLSTTRLWEAAAMAAIGVRAAGPQPEVAPNHACLGSARVALIAGRGSVSTAARPGSPARPALGGRAPITSRLAR